MKRSIAAVVLGLVVLASTACGPAPAPVAQPGAPDGWVTPPIVASVAADGTGLVAAGLADPLGRVVLRADDGAAYAVGADAEGRFELRLPRPAQDTLFLVEARVGQLGYPAPYRLFVAADPEGPIALLAAGTATRRLDPAPALDAVDGDGRGRLLSGRARPGAAVPVTAGRETRVTAGEDGRWTLTAPPSGPVAVSGQAFSPIAAGGGPGDLIRVDGGWSLAWSGPDGARQTTWFPARPETVR